MEARQLKVCQTQPTRRPKIGRVTGENEHEQSEYEQKENEYEQTDVEQRENEYEQNEYEQK